MTDHNPLKARDVRPVVPFVTPKVTNLSNGMSYPEFADRLMRSMADALGVPHHLITSGPSYEEVHRQMVEERLKSRPLRPSFKDNSDDPQFPDMAMRRQIEFNRAGAAAAYGECVTLPNGDCVGQGCMHDVERPQPRPAPGGKVRGA